MSVFSYQQRNNIILVTIIGLLLALCAQFYFHLYIGCHSAIRYV
jgi:hypothetical protein